MDQNLQMGCAPKRLIALLLVSAIAVMLNGCGDSTEGPRRSPNGGTRPNIQWNESEGSSWRFHADSAEEACERCAEPGVICDTHYWGDTDDACYVHADTTPSYHCVVPSGLDCPPGRTCSTWEEITYYGLPAGAPCAEGKTKAPAPAPGPANCERCWANAKCDRLGPIGWGDEEAPCYVHEDNKYHCVLNACLDGHIQGKRCYAHLDVFYYVLPESTPCADQELVVLTTTSTTPTTTASQGASNVDSTSTAAPSDTTTHAPRTTSCETCKFGHCERWNGYDKPCAEIEHGNQGFFHHCLVDTCPDGYTCETWPPEDPFVTFYAQPADSPCIAASEHTDDLVIVPEAHQNGHLSLVAEALTVSVDEQLLEEDLWCEKCHIGTCDHQGDMCGPCHVFNDNTIHCIVDTCPPGIDGCYSYPHLPFSVLNLPKDAPCLEKRAPFQATVGRQLKWSDEFDSGSQHQPPNAAIWNHETGGGGWGNNEEQYYTDRLVNSYISDGTLKIVARREDFQGMRYTSARLTSKHNKDWLYGRTEVRARLPLGGGTWCALWMLPTDWAYGAWPLSGEIDIMEHVGNYAGQAHASVHTSWNNFKNQLAGASTNHTCSQVEEWRVYSLEWTPSQLQFFVDSNMYFTYANNGEGWADWPFDKFFHMMLNVAVGGSWGGHGRGVDEQSFTGSGQILEIDYVRVYE